MSSSTPCLGYMRACSKALPLIRAEATVKELCTRISSSSTWARRVRTSRTVSRNCFINSSRLSLSSLCPRWAVLSLPLSRVSSIRVGLVTVTAIAVHLAFWSGGPPRQARGIYTGSSGIRANRAHRSTTAAARHTSLHAPCLRKYLHMAASSVTPSAPSWAGTCRYSPAGSA